jgi:hypothetical protein
MISNINFELQSTFKMENQNEHLDALKDIRNIMERSSRFVSLNGLSGVFAGAFALCGALAANMYIERMKQHIPVDALSSVRNGSAYYDFALTPAGKLSTGFMQFFILDALIVLFLSVSVATFLTVRKAKKDGLKIWDNTAKRLFINMMVPLVSGGVFCLIMTWHGTVQYVAPAMLIFYGMALINSSKYTYEDIRYLGMMEIGLGLLAAIFIANGLLFWAIGFGVLHIIYGILMYFKYER